MVPPRSDARWREVVTGRNKVQFSFLALKMLMTRIELQMQKEPSEATIEKGVDALHLFFTRFSELVPDDLRKILDPRGTTP